MHLPDSNNTSYSCGMIIFVPKCPGLLVMNLATELGLYNSAPIIMESLVYDYREPPFDNDPHLGPQFLKYRPVATIVTVPGSSHELPLGSILPDKSLMLWPEKFQVKHVNESFQRTQFPIVHGCWFTDYKMQGQSVHWAVIDALAFDNKQQPQSVYVMMSRLRSHHGVYLLQSMDLRNLQHKPPSALITYLTSLDIQNTKTQAKWKGPYDEAYPNFVPKEDDHPYFSSDNPTITQTFEELLEYHRPDTSLLLFPGSVFIRISLTKHYFINEHKLHTQASKILSQEITVHHLHHQHTSVIL